MDVKITEMQELTEQVIRNPLLSDPAKRLITLQVEQIRTLKENQAGLVDALATLIVYLTEKGGEVPVSPEAMEALNRVKC